jgi:hypothetical protein
MLDAVRAGRQARRRNRCANANLHFVENDVVFGRIRPYDVIVVRIAITPDDSRSLINAARNRLERDRDFAVATALLPTSNFMVLAGIVTLPGTMTGQLLAGVDPLSTVRYQIVIMFLLLSGTALGTLVIALLTYYRLFNSGISSFIG